MDDYQITTDVFTLPYEGNDRILYAPLKNLVCVVNADACELLAGLPGLDMDSLNDEQKSTLEFFEQKGVLNSNPGHISRTIPDAYEPTRVTLFSTNQCNLRCIYCYASAGEQKSVIMPLNTARTAIDFVVDNIKAKALKTLKIGFHGGGEPLLPWKRIQQIVRFAEKRAREENLKPLVFAATNAVLSEAQLEWIIAHFTNLNISFDGLPHVQDKHRPLSDGRGSFQFVDRTMKFLDKHNFAYGIRSTVSQYNIDLMDETIEFIGQNYKTKYVHLEPLFMCGRCQTTDSHAPSMEAFCDHFIKCEDTAAKYDIHLIYSGASLEKMGDCFCGVSSDSFNVTPDGYITPCYEITDKDDPRADTFFYGKLRGDRFEIDEEKRRFLNTLYLDHYPFCKDCFAKYHCGGECVAKLYGNDLHGERGHDRCRLNRDLTARRLRRVVDGHYKILKK